MQEPKEKRNNPRHKVEFVAHAHNQKLHLVAAKILDVSNHGAFVVRDNETPLQPGDELSIDIFTGKWSPTLRTQCTVTWVGRSAFHQKDGFGVRFNTPTTLPDFNGQWQPPQKVA